MNPPRRTVNVRRLGYYLIGVAIGFVLLGLYFQQRQAYVARQRAAAQLEAEQAAKADAEHAATAPQAKQAAPVTTPAPATQPK